MMSKKLASITSTGTYNMGGPAEIQDNDELKSQLRSEYKSRKNVRQ